MTLERARRRAESDAESRGYRLNPDEDFLNDLLDGLARNENRFGYPACPCRLPSGRFDLDRDIICPCDYRDPDVEEYGFCYCGLYVSKDAFEGKAHIGPIPERRPREKQARANAAAVGKDEEGTEAASKLKGKPEMKMWYCRQCGYVCFREEPPYVCPICKAKREMFSEITASFHPT
ncbi:MAG: ferredoxin:glutaredoxin reductase [Candidatus Brockarchaeota archaeon]|nr:ferredoxin:glutaredoxin reductase [Candidatus Brockarchaeota archaeon]